MSPIESTSYSIDASGLPYLLFCVGNNTYGISSEFVRGIETLGETTDMITTDPNIRGNVIYQDNLIYLIDMRKLFGLDSQLDEFEKRVQPNQRIQDHENWISALEKSVTQNSEFTLTDDPHQCAFGKWYYSFATNNNILKHRLKAIEKPHEAIHNTAKRIKELKRENKNELALSEIKEMRDTYYKTTIQILSSLRDIMASSIKEIYIVLESDSGMKGIIVDSIVGVEYLSATLQIPGDMEHRDYIQFISRRKHSNELVIVLDNSI